MAKASKSKNSAGRANGVKGKVITLKALQKQAILGAVKHANDDKLKAARMLGIGKTTLYRKLKEYGY